MSKFNSHVHRLYGLAANVGVEAAELAELYDAQTFDRLSYEMREGVRDAEEDIDAASKALNRALARLAIVQSALREQSKLDRDQFDFLRAIELGPKDGPG